MEGVSNPAEPIRRNRVLEGAEYESAIRILSERYDPRIRWAKLLLQPRAWAQLLTFGDEARKTIPRTKRSAGLKAAHNPGETVHKLISSLETLPPGTPELESRLAQLHLLLGRHDRAAHTLETAPRTPLAFAMQLMVLATRYDFEAVIELAPQIDHRDDTPLGREARARALLAVAIAHHGRAAYPRALECLQQAFLLPGALPGFTERVWALREQCHTLSGERHPMEQEHEFRALLSRTSGLEARYHIEELLLRLLEKTGRYAEAAEIAATLPDDRLSHAHRDLLRVATGTLERSVWLKHERNLVPHLGALNAVRALGNLDAKGIIEGLAPPVRVQNTSLPTGDAIPGVDARSFAMWNLALAWAFVHRAEVARALEWLQNAFVPRSEWDARFLKNLVLIEGFILEPDRLEAYYNTAAIIRETRWLIEERLSSSFVFLPLAPRLAPHAVALLLTSPEGCPSLEAHARPALGVISSRGLQFSDLLYLPQISAVKLLLAPNGKPRGMSPGAVRQTRLYLRRLLEARGNPALVYANRVYRAIERIESSERGDDRRAWHESYLQYRNRYGQLVVWSQQESD